MIINTYRMPWKDKEASCLSCGTSVTLTAKDRPAVDKHHVEEVYNIEGTMVGYIGVISFLFPCPSCEDVIRWTKPV